VPCKVFPTFVTTVCLDFLSVWVMIVPINGKFSEWRKRPSSAALLVLVAILAGRQGWQQIQETRERVRFSEQLGTGLDQLMNATEAISADKMTTKVHRSQKSLQTNVDSYLAKVDVAGPNPVARSNQIPNKTSKTPAIPREKLEVIRQRRAVIESNR
jgi:hypothetical protein